MKKIDVTSSLLINTESNTNQIITMTIELENTAVDPEYNNTECTENNSVAYFIYSKTGLKFLVKIIYLFFYFVGYLIFNCYDCWITFSNGHTRIAPFISLISGLLFIILVSLIEFILVFSVTYCFPDDCYVYGYLIIWSIPFVAAACIISFIILAILLSTKIYKEINQQFIICRQDN